jgi:hypothetical protein
LYLRAIESNQFKFLDFGAGAIIPDKQIFQLHIGSLEPRVELLCGGAAAIELVWQSWSLAKHALNQ